MNAYRHRWIIIILFSHEKTIVDIIQMAVRTRIYLFYWQQPYKLDLDQYARIALLTSLIVRS